MSDTCKTKLEVLKVIRMAVIEGLAKMGVPDAASWQCAESSQAKVLNADKIILLKQTKSSPATWVMTKYAGSGTGTESTDEWNDLETWSIDVVHKRKANPQTPAQSTTEDVCSALLAWFNGRGCAFMRKHGLSNLRITEKDVKVYDDDSAVYQNRTEISLRVNVPRSRTFSEEVVDGMGSGILPV